jgi:hypothetical protein
MWFIHLQVLVVVLLLFMELNLVIFLWWLGVEAVAINILLEAEVVVLFITPQIHLTLQIAQ